MATRLLRSPQYITATQGIVGGTTVKSSKLTISIEGTIEYTLIKDAVDGVPTLFEWGELSRDFLDITFNGTYSTQAAFDIILTLNFWDTVNAGGLQVGGNSSQTNFGLDGYGTFYEAASPAVSAIQFPAISNYSQAVAGGKTYTVYAPKDTAVVVPAIVSGTTTYTSSGINAISVDVPGTLPQTTVNIIRRECTKYTASLGYTETSTNGYPVSFINKFGAIQTEWFTLKAVQRIESKKETYNSNTISSTGTYSINEHNKQNFNVKGTQSITLNSFYVDESYNNVFTEMLLSEKVWVRFRVPSTNDYTTVPINITTSSFDYKNSINDRLIQFTFSFDMSFDFINNVR